VCSSDRCKSVVDELRQGQPTMQCNAMPVFLHRQQAGQGAVTAGQFQQPVAHVCHSRRRVRHVFVHPALQLLAKLAMGGTRDNMLRGAAYSAHPQGGLCPMCMRLTERKHSQRLALQVWISKGHPQRFPSHLRIALLLLGTPFLARRHSTGCPTLCLVLSCCRRCGRCCCGRLLCVCRLAGGSGLRLVSCHQLGGLQQRPEGRSNLTDVAHGVLACWAASECCPAAPKAAGECRQEGCALICSHAAVLLTHRARSCANL